MENMKILREKQKLTQKQLADLVGLAPSSIANYETGKREPSIAVLVELDKIHHPDRKWL